MDRHATVCPDGPQHCLFPNASRKRLVSSCLVGPPFCRLALSLAFRLHPFLKLDSTTPPALSRNCSWHMTLHVVILRSDLIPNQSSTQNYPSPTFRTGDLVWFHRPYTVSDGPYRKLVSPWRGSYCMRVQSSPVTYRVTKDGELGETNVHLGWMKQYRRYF